MLINSYLYLKLGQLIKMVVLLMSACTMYQLMQDPTVDDRYGKIWCFITST